MVVGRAKRTHGGSGRGGRGRRREFEARRKVTNLAAPLSI